MFKLFQKDGKTNIIDRVFVHQQFKWNHCLNILEKDPNTIFIGWFDDTINQLEKFLAEKNTATSAILTARSTQRSHVEGSRIIFIEHHPMKTKEDILFAELNLKEAIILTSLDEPLLSIFGGEKMIGILQKLGIKEDEIIEHKLVTQSIANAQRKIEERMSIEQTTRSQTEWIERNLSK